MKPASSFNADERDALLDVAFHAIAQGLGQAAARPPRPDRYPAAVQAVRASFVTLKIAAELRGCIGTLEAVRPLIEDVRANAFAAAFRDPRFPPVEEAELKVLQISISVLSVPQPVDCTSEQGLIAQLRPGIDGLILEEAYRRGTFLPAVWQSLPEPQAFVRQLKLKAGLQPDYWSPSLRVYRYHAEVIGDE